MESRNNYIIVELKKGGSRNRTFDQGRFPNQFIFKFSSFQVFKFSSFQVFKFSVVFSNSPQMKRIIWPKATLQWGKVWGLWFTIMY